MDCTDMVALDAVHPSIATSEPASSWRKVPRVQALEATIARLEAERARLEERLRQAEKLEAIGRFASGIAHDFNNVLHGIVAYGEMLLDDAPDAKRQRYAQNVLTAAERGRGLVEQVLGYTRGMRVTPPPTDACASVAETLELLRASVPASVSLVPSFPDAPVLVVGRATRLHQA